MKGLEIIRRTCSAKKQEQSLLFCARSLNVCSQVDLSSRFFRMVASLEDLFFSLLVRRDCLTDLSINLIIRAVSQCPVLAFKS